MKNNYKVIGLMSGTSLDGLDLAYCVFDRRETGWHYRVEHTGVLKYARSWKDALMHAGSLSGEELIKLDVRYGAFLGKACRDFIQKHNLEVDFIASHGHTVFHRPGNSSGFTYQIGNGNALHATAGLPVVFDFRSLDVALGGQGAPLVPIGDKLLFHEYEVCLNLGGIANLSTDIEERRVAYDVCFCNMPLNYLMNTRGKGFDQGGKIAASGNVNETLLGQLNKVYSRIHRKRPSLGREMFEETVQPLLDQKKIPFEDKLCTVVESTALEIARPIRERKGAQVLTTGGGAFNAYLISRILHYLQDEAVLVIPDDEIVKFKEALVFAFLGLLTVEKQINCLKTVTGASRDSRGGLMIGF